MAKKKELQSLATGLLLIQLLNGTTIIVLVQKAIALLCHFLPNSWSDACRFSNILCIIFEVCTHMREGLQDTIPQNS